MKKVIAAVGIALLLGAAVVSGQFLYISKVCATDAQCHTVPAVTSDTFALLAAAQTLTNKTLDAEGTGNLLTMPWLVRFPAAFCNNVTATAFDWSLPATNPAVPTCQTGTNTNFATLNFPDGAVTISAQTLLPVPADVTGAMDVRLDWFTSATTGAVVWQVATICVAAGATADPAFNAASTVTSTAPAVASQTKVDTITAVTITGCSAASPLMFLKVFRDPTHASDTLAADASLVWIEAKLRRAM